VNQQPPMHKLRMRPLKPFWDEPKTHPPCPRFFFFPHLFSAPKIFPPTYLPPPSFPPSYLPPPPPSYLPPTSHSITRPWEQNGAKCSWKSDSLSGKGSSKAKEVGPTWDPERQLHGKLPSANFFFFGCSSAKKATTAAVACFFFSLSASQ
jgi:hypothetical protein